MLELDEDRTIAVIIPPHIAPGSIDLTYSVAPSMRMLLEAAHALMPHYSRQKTCIRTSHMDEYPCHPRHPRHPRSVFIGDKGHATMRLIDTGILLDKTLA